jgi:site-specific recombinase XerD
VYSARHSFATDLLDRTGNLKLVMDVLGHESVTTTQKYPHLFSRTWLRRSIRETKKGSRGSRMRANVVFHGIVEL